VLLSSRSDRWKIDLSLSTANGSIAAAKAPLAPLPVQRK